MRVAWMTELFLVLAFLLIIPLWAGEDHVLRTVWGEDFLRGSSPGDVGMTYRLVLLTLPVAYMFNMFMSTTIATERQRKVLPAVFFPLMMEMALFLLLIPFLGIVGAALSHMAFLASGAVWMAWNLHGRYGSTGFLRGARRPLISFIPAFIILLLSPLEAFLTGSGSSCLPGRLDILRRSWDRSRTQELNGKASPGTKPASPVSDRL